MTQLLLSYLILDWVVFREKILVWSNNYQSKILKIEILFVIKYE